jgi:ferritin-like metal-binding protein YciE
MPDDTMEQAVDSLPQLYLDLLWGIDAASSIMLIKLPKLAAAAADPELTTVLRDGFASANHHHLQLESILRRFDQPSRVHAAALETLLATAADHLHDSPTGRVKDVGISSLARTVIHMALPGCEIAMNVAGTLGYETQVESLASLHQDLVSMDAKLVAIVRESLDAHTRWTATHLAVEPPRSDARH